MPYRLEYRTANTLWETYIYCGSIVMLMIEADKLRNQGFEVRCKNEVGQDILNKGN